MKNFFWVAVAIMLPWGALQAASKDRIVAVVNDEIITLSELKARTTLGARALGIDMQNPQAGNALLRRTLGELVDEALQRQYAQDRNLQLTKAEFQAAKDAIVSQAGATRWAELTKGVGKAADDKLRAEATWARLMAMAVAPRVQLGTAELDKLIEEMSKTQNKTEKNLSMIFIPHSEAEVLPAAGEAVSGTALPDTGARIQALRAELTAPEANEATFAAAAKTNSAAPSAKDGGALGWLTPAEIPSGIDAAIQGLGAGEITQPLRTPEGWLLVRVNDIRTDAAAIDLQPITQYQVYLLAAARPSDTAAVAELSKALQTTAKQHDKAEAVAALFDTDEVKNQFDRSSALGWVATGVLQPDVAKAVAETKPGRWTKLLSSANQLSMLYVAETRQVMPPAILALRERVAQNLRANRTELEARRFMRELRQRAFVDIRL